MPTYEYECKTCSEKFDLFQSIKAAPLRRARCESCGGIRPVRRLIGSGGAILFKGTGFYQTDYRSDSYQRAAKADSGASTTAASGSEGTVSTEKDRVGGGSEASPSKTETGKKKPSKAAATGAAT